MDLVLKNIKNKANQIKLIVQIEHIDAVNNLEEILNLEHIDGTFIGPYDLSDLWVNQRI